MVAVKYQRYKNFIVVCSIILGMVGILQFQCPNVMARDSQTITREINGKSVRGTLVTWGSSNWALADNGELMLVDGI